MGTVYLAAETLTQNEVINMWEKKHGEKLQVTYITGKELEGKKSSMGREVRFETLGAFTVLTKQFLDSVFIITGPNGRNSSR